MNVYWISAGLINLIASIMHIVIGYYDPLEPLKTSSMNPESISTLFAVWYMVTLVMFGSSFVLLYAGWKPNRLKSFDLVYFMSILYILFALIFFFFSLPQWVLLLPIGLLALYGKKVQENAILHR